MTDTREHVLWPYDEAPDSTATDEIGLVAEAHRLRRMPHSEEWDLVPEEKPEWFEVTETGPEEWDAVANYGRGPDTDKTLEDAVAEMDSKERDAIADELSRRRKEFMVKYEAHPLYNVFMMALDQVMFGKGERHGGDTVPFLDQPWVHYSKLHGRGFLTGQAAKKLEEAASGKKGKEFIQEVLGAIVYAGMSILHERS